MTLNEELVAIEAAVSECEKEIASGKISVESDVRQIKSIADPQARIAKLGEITAVHMKRIDTLNIERLTGLKLQNPNNARIAELGRKAAKCYLTLMRHGLSTSEELSPPERKPQLQALHEEAMVSMKMTLNHLL